MACHFPFSMSEIESEQNLEIITIWTLPKNNLRYIIKKMKLAGVLSRNVAFIDLDEEKNDLQAICYRRNFADNVC